VFCSGCFASIQEPALKVTSRYANSSRQSPLVYAGTQEVPGGEVVVFQELTNWSTWRFAKLVKGVLPDLPAIFRGQKVPQPTKFVGLNSSNTRLDSRE
jgi:hypothetical protein